MNRIQLFLAFGALCMSSLPALSQNDTVTLDALRGEHRVLLVFANGNNQLAEAQLTVAADHASGFEERALLLAGITGSNPAVPAATLSAAEDATARKRFHVASGQFTVILLGKDGGEKLRSHQPIAWEKLKTTIDGMPMRQGEMHAP